MAAAVRGGGMPLQSSGLALGGSLVTLEKDHGTALICTLSSTLQQAYPIHDVHGQNHDVHGGQPWEPASRRGARGDAHHCHVPGAAALALP